MAQLPVKIIRVPMAGTQRDCVVLVPPGQNGVSAAQVPLVPQSIVGVLTGLIEPGQTVAPSMFVLNQAFVDFMHQVISLHGPDNPAIISEAKRHRSGYVFVIDQRASLSSGIVPPTDLLGAFAVERGRILAGSYVSNPQYALLTNDGFTQLDEALLERLLDALVNISTSQTAPATPPTPAKQP